MGPAQRPAATWRVVQFALAVPAFSGLVAAVVWTGISVAHPSWAVATAADTRWWAGLMVVAGLLLVVEAIERRLPATGQAGSGAVDPTA